METSHSVSTLLIMTVMCLAALSTVTTAQLVENYYKAKCPNKNVNVEDVVTSAVNTAFSRNGASMAGVLRIHFHDCFVNVAFDLSTVIYLVDRLVLFVFL